MMIIGCDYHPSWQQISWLDTESGDCGERKLVHATGEAKLFYEQLTAPVLIGMEATGNSQWFVELVEDMGHTVWIGDAAEIRASGACPELAEGCGSRRRTSGTRRIF